MVRAALKKLLGKKGKHGENDQHYPKIPAQRKPGQAHKHEKKKEGK